MTIEIEKNVPIPPVKKKGAGRRPAYPWLELEIGDSFFVETDKPETFNRQAYNAASRYGVKFSCRKVEGGSRIWRVE